MSDAALEARAISVERGGCHIIRSVDLRCTPGEVLALIGPNGAGKTTLLTALLGIGGGCTGSVQLGQRDLLRLDPHERARRIAYVPQHSLLGARLSGEEVVAMGRYPHRHRRGVDHRQVVAEALAATDCIHLKDRPYAVCSGGEQARLLLARALATEADFLLLDEPTAALDLAHGLHFFALVRHLAAAGKGVVMVLHRLDDALRWADSALVLDGGDAVAHGPVGEVLSQDLMRRVFKVRMVSGGQRFELDQPSEAAP